MKLNKILLFVFVIFAIAAISGCSKKSEEKITFDNSYPLALAPDVEWAVVTEPYAVFKETDEWDAATAGHCRKGEILLIKGKSVDDKKENWYFFEGGWLPQNCVSVFSNRYKAENVSKNLLSSE
ncbi:MAG: hypothetical protein J6X84_00025 [Treponema sp.]|nr:hypothetical protein [Treponema sp.]